jgi:hypothetical protein
LKVTASGKAKFMKTRYLALLSLLAATFLPQLGLAQVPVFQI